LYKMIVALLCIYH